MSDNIKLLEELVVQAVDRIQELTRERDELSKRVEALEEAERGHGSAQERARRARQAQAVLELREALDELRGEPGAA